MPSGTFLNSFFKVPVKETVFTFTHPPCPQGYRQHYTISFQRTFLFIASPAEIRITSVRILNRHFDFCPSFRAVFLSMRKYCLSFQTATKFAVYNPACSSFRAAYNNHPIRGKVLKIKLLNCKLYSVFIYFSFQEQKFIFKAFNLDDVFFTLFLLT